ncbi:MAG TPA: hypothetical protein VJ654_12040 [Noviherbaspirillum sp.]|nr:hypothetical protein [Noviherbaspirillum sp.]
MFFKKWHLCAPTRTKDARRHISDFKWQFLVGIKPVFSRDNTLDYPRTDDRNKNAEKQVGEHETKYAGHGKILPRKPVHDGEDNRQSEAETKIVPKAATKISGHLEGTPYD